MNFASPERELRSFGLVKSLGREAHRATKGKSLTDQDKQRCMEAISQFGANPRHPGLNFERLGSEPSHNHWSIRASKELRVILSVGKIENGQPAEVMVANFGHHDQMYDWSSRQRFHSDVSEGVEIETPSPRGGTSAFPLADFEEWQLYLYPDQKALVKRQFDREARLYGGAGTGKSVILLHRAARLGRENPDGQILVTAFHKVLTSRLAELYCKLPNAPKNVEFRSVFQVARSVIGDLGIDRRVLDDAFDEAYRRIVPGTHVRSCTPEYLRDEIERVIKGRSASKDEYLDTGRFQRVGRQRGFKKRDRETCWALREAWDEELQRRGNRSFADALELARETLETEGKPVYRAALIDEAQDLTASAIRMIRASVAGSPDSPIPRDGLLFVDDKAQQIYPGGFRTAWAGLNFKGRSVHLSTGHRTTRQIARAAAAVRGQFLVDKSDTDINAVEVEGYSRDDGQLPILRQTDKKELSEVISIIRRLVDTDGYNWREIAILSMHRNDLNACHKYLIKNRIPALLQRYRAGDPDGVRVVTFDSCKGQEYRAVIIPRVGNSVFPLSEDDKQVQTGTLQLDLPESAPVEELDAEALEKRQLNLDRLYVAMTRACERLFLICGEAPGLEIERARDHFDWYAPSRPFDLSSTDTS